MDEPESLRGLRVLVVEDELLVAMLIEEMCADLGCQVVGPAATLVEALARSQGHDFDVALVDLHLDGMRADPVIAELEGRFIPFAVASGASYSSIDSQNALVLHKPFDFGQFTKCMTDLAACLSARRHA